MIETIIHKQKRKYLIFSFVFISLFLVFVLIDLSTGSSGFSFDELKRILEFDNLKDWYIFYELRLPRTVTAIVIGVILGTSGVIVQNVLKNPLATPFTLGISHASAFGASFAIIVLDANRSNSEYQIYLILTCALISALLCLGIILVLSFYAKLTPSSIILAGVSMSALFHALTMFIQYFADDTQLASAIVWSFGDVSKTSYEDIWILLSLAIPIYLFFQLKAMDYNVILFGDNEGKNLGINTKFLRLISMFLASLITAIATSFVGVIAFIGLVAPHLVRLIFKNDYRILVPFSALVGAFLLVLANIGSKSILAPLDIPVGILTPFIGVPMLIYLLIRKGK